MKLKQKLLSSLLTLMMLFSALFVFTAPAHAQRYDCGTYGADSFGAAQDCGGEISDTGQPLIYIVPAGLVILGVLVLYRVNRKKPPKDKE